MPFDGRTATPIANAMRKVLGPNGEHWCKFSRDDSRGHHCILGALDEAYGYTLEGRGAAERLDAAVLQIDAKNKRRVVYGSGVTGGISADYNNSPDTTFADITRVIDAFAEIEARETINA